MISMKEAYENIKELDKEDWQSLRNLAKFGIPMDFLITLSLFPYQKRIKSQGELDKIIQEELKKFDYPSSKLKGIFEQGTKAYSTKKFPWLELGDPFDVHLKLGSESRYSTVSIVKAQIYRLRFPSRQDDIVNDAKNQTKALWYGLTGMVHKN